MKLNLEKIRTELGCKVKLNKKGYRLSTRETDKEVIVSINPCKIRSQGQLDRVMEQCQDILKG